MEHFDSLNEYLERESADQNQRDQVAAAITKQCNDKAHEWKQNLEPKKTLTPVQLDALRTAAQKLGRSLDGKQIAEVLARVQ